MLKESIFKYYQHYYKDTLGLPNWEALTSLRVEEEREERRRLDHFEEKVGPIKGEKILNIGCGTGGFNIVAHERGAEAYGIDTDTEAIRICHLKADQYGIPKERFILSGAENLPFEKNTFDLINCYTVLEHVHDVEKSLREMVRVTKPGGKIYTNGPHYWCLYEAHYKIFWCPIFLIRPIGRLYLFLRGRPAAFFDTLNFLHNRTIKNALRSEDVQITQHRKDLVKGPGFMSSIAYFYYRIFGIDSNVEIIITKH